MSATLRGKRSAPATPRRPSRAPPRKDDSIDTYRGLVHALSWRILQRLPRDVELDDLVGYGQLGLLLARRDFDPSRGCKFITYAYHRIRGSILDGLRQMSGFDPHRFHGARYARDEADGGSSDPSDPASTLDAPEALLATRELVSTIRQLVHELPSDEQVLIRAMYYEGLTLGDVGRQLGRSKSWACRVHARVIDRLAASLRRAGLGN